MSETSADIESKSDRLFSLDALRGLDMVLLTVVFGLVHAINAGWALPAGFMRQFDHFWGGFTLWDIIMPLFIFICGAAVPLALPKRMENGRAGFGYWRHVVSRVALLWILGMISQGRLLTLDADKIYFFTNTLQSIAVGYAAAACVLLIPNVRLRRAVPVVLALLYAGLMHFGGDYSQQGNIAMRVDMFFVHVLQPVAGHDSYCYTWYLTSLMFAAMTLCGMEATFILTGSHSKFRKGITLAVLGGVLLAVGWAIVSVVPMIKHVYSLSFTAQAMGWSCLAYAGLYVLTDVFKFRRGWGFVLLFGRNALLAYMAIEVFGGVFDAFGRQVAQGIPHLVGAKYQALVAWAASTAFLTFILMGRDALRAVKKSKKG